MTSSISQPGFEPGVADPPTRRALLEARRQVTALLAQLAIAEGDITTIQSDITDIETHLAGMIQTGTYTPALTNIAIGTGGSAGNTANYMWVGGPDLGDEGLLYLDGVVTLGTSGASVSGAISVGGPDADFEFIVGVGPRAQVCRLEASGNFIGNVVVGSINTLNLNALRASGTYLDTVSTSATIPGSWVAGSKATWGGVFRAERV